HPGPSVVPRLCQLVQLLLEADDKLTRLAVTLPCNLDSIGVIDGAAVYVGLMPEASVPAGPRPRSDPRALLAQLEFVAAGLRDRALDLDQVFARMPGMSPLTEGIVPALTAFVTAARAST